MEKYDAKDFPGILSILRFLAESDMFGPIDRISNALNPETVRAAIYEALRIVNSAIRREAIVKLELNEGVKKELKVCDWGEMSPTSVGHKLALKGKLKEVKEGPKELENLIGKYIYAIKTPRLPSEDELNKFLSNLDSPKGLKLAKELAMLALTIRG